MVTRTQIINKRTPSLGASVARTVVRAVPLVPTRGTMKLITTTAHDRFMIPICREQQRLQMIRRRRSRRKSGTGGTFSSRTLMSHTLSLDRVWKSWIYLLKGLPLLGFCQLTIYYYGCFIISEFYFLLLLPSINQFTTILNVLWGAYPLLLCCLLFYTFEIFELISNLVFFSNLLKHSHSRAMRRVPGLLSRNG